MATARSSRRDPERTRARILAAALAEFAAKGIAGARVDAIAAAAEVNKRMLYHYFGSKDGLYRAVLHQRLTEPAARPADPGLDAGERAARLHDRFAGSRDYVRLLMWEALERDGDVEDEPARRAALAALVDAVAADQPERTRADAAQHVLSDLGACVVAYAFPQLARMVTGQGPDGPAFADRRRRFLADEVVAVPDRAARRSG